MQKIMFNDKFGLTGAVLSHAKTMTRRFINGNYSSIIVSKGKYLGVVSDEKEYVRIIPKYKIGEVLAVAQSYESLGYAPDALDRDPKDLGIRGFMKDSAGWNNKMFVRADACKNHIKITGIRVERLQYISEEDCIKEGLKTGRCGNEITGWLNAYYVPGDIQPYLTPRDAFEVLIDKITGKGTWVHNPFVFVYKFELTQIR